VILVGVTGGIGSGKSTVARMLEEHGAVVIDADELARRAVAPGSAGLAQILETFGGHVRTPDGSLDREALAAVVFADPEKRRALEAITHPEVARLFAEATARYRDMDAVVVYDVPLLVENRLEAMFDAVVVVTAPEDVRVARLRADRGMSQNAARERIASQATDAERARVATFTLENDGSMETLRADVGRLWNELRSISSGR
jgi:dephospho-CoA kinase